jgi:hypothetical protein
MSKSPPKLPSPEDSTTEEDEEYRLFWFKYVEGVLQEAGREGVYSQKQEVNL